VTYEWTAESPATWDGDKARIVGEAPEGIFDRRYASLKTGELAPGTWWRVKDGGETVGFGWLDIVWGDAEILLITAPEQQRKGVGQFILEHLATEAHKLGLNYLYNTVRPTHPKRSLVSEWLQKHGFTPSEDGSLLRASSAA